MKTKCVVKLYDHQTLTQMAPTFSTQSEEESHIINYVNNNKKIEGSKFFLVSKTNQHNTVLKCFLHILCNMHCLVTDSKQNSC